jgi:hypothetical protein
MKKANPYNLLLCESTNPYEGKQLDITRENGQQTCER